MRPRDCTFVKMASLGKRRGRKKHAGKQASPFKKPKADNTVDSRPVIDEVDDVPSSYQVLIDSLQLDSRHMAPKLTNVIEETTGSNIAEETLEQIEQIPTDEVDLPGDPFSTHFDHTLKEEQVEHLKDIYSKPLQLQSKEENKHLGLVQWLDTPTSCIEWTGLANVNKPRPLQLLHVRQPMATVWTDPITPLQYQLFNVLNSYRDLLYTNCTAGNHEEIRRVYVLHTLNHVIKNRSRVLKNNARLAAIAKQVGVANTGGFRDQGLTRPKVLILLPFRSAALRTVEMMIETLFSSGKGEVFNKKRLLKEFGSESEDKPPKYKPDSYLQLFEGNSDDCFRVGLTVRKTALKLYTKFYSSDIILASPLGIRMIIGGEGDKNRDYDFLSSLEMVIVDQMDVFLMQNWDHLMHVFSHLHLQPGDSHGVDFSRVREWALCGWGPYYCQNLFFSSFTTPEINSLATKHFRSYEGQVRVSCPLWVGSVCQVVLPVPQTFHRIKSLNHRELAENRFSYFVDNILPKLSAAVMDHTCIYLPSYYDFVRVRNHLKKEEIDFTVMSEYTEPSSVSRARSFFSTGRKRLLLITERLHFFRRYRITGIRHLVFYAPPTYHEFYSEIVNMMKSSSDDSGSVLVLYSEYDLLALQRIIGTSNAMRLLKSQEPKQTLITEKQ